MSIEIGSVTTHVTATVRVHLSGTVELTADYVNRQVQPYYAEIRYAYRQTAAEGGWTGHSWSTVHVRVVGHRILKPGPDGAQRLGKATHESSWSGYGAYSDVQDRKPRKPMPEWLDLIVSAYRPSGDLTLAGGL